MAKEAFPVHDSANTNDQEGMTLRDYTLIKLTASWTSTLGRFDSAICVADIGAEAIRLAVIQTEIIMKEVGYEG